MRQLKITKSITNRNEATLDRYLSEIGKIPLITSEEEIILAQKIRTGDAQSLEKLTKANLRFVVSVAKQYQNQGLSLPDLINEGNLGLIKAAKRFDETRGFKFISYAVRWIRQRILQAISEQARIIKLPLSQTGHINKIRKTSSALEQQFQRVPTLQELADALDFTEGKIKESLSMSGRHISLDAEISDDNSTNTLLDVLFDENDPFTDQGLINNDLINEIGRVLITLPPREADVIRLYFGLDGRSPMTLQEIGKKYGITRDMIKQIKDKALRRMKHSSIANLLRKYME